MTNISGSEDAKALIAQARSMCPTEPSEEYLNALRAYLHQWIGDVEAELFKFLAKEAEASLDTAH